MYIGMNISPSLGALLLQYEWQIRTNTMSLLEQDAVLCNYTQGSSHLLHTFNVSLPNFKFRLFSVHILHKGLIGLSTSLDYGPLQ